MAAIARRAASEASGGATTGSAGPSRIWSARTIVRASRAAGTSASPGRLARARTRRQTASRAAVRPSSPYQRASSRSASRSSGSPAVARYASRSSSARSRGPQLRRVLERDRVHALGLARVARPRPELTQAEVGLLARRVEAQSLGVAARRDVVLVGRLVLPRLPEQL